MGVYKPKKSRYWQYDFVYQGRRFHGSTGQETRGKALKVEAAKRLSAGKGEAVRHVAGLTIDEAAQRYWIEHGQFKASAKDIDNRINIAVALLGRATPIIEIDAERVSRAIQKRRVQLVKGKRLVTNATVNRDLIDTTLRPILRRARRVWKVQGLPEIDWGALRLEEPAPHPRDFTAKEITGLYDALAPHWRDFARFQARYALRLGEMFFPLSAIDVEGRRLSIMRTVRKNKRPHDLPLLDDDVAMLSARLGRAAAAGLSTVWFRENRRGKLLALTYRGGLAALRQGMTDCGLRASKGARGSHDLRHHGGMQMLRASKNLRATQKLLGHVSIQSTLTYAHALDDDVRAGLEAVSRSVPEPPNFAADITEEKQRDSA